MNSKIIIVLLSVLLAGVLYWAIGLKNENQELIKEIHSVNCTRSFDPANAAGFIHASEGIGKINAYLDYLDSINIVDSGLLKSGNYNIPLANIPDSNRKVMHFRISQPCELAEILSVADNRDSIFAMLSLTKRPDVAHEEGMIDLIFKAKTRYLPDSTDLVDNHGFQYFDFATPCPPLCND